MKKEQLADLLAAEIEAWSLKTYGQLIQELADVVAYQREDPESHQFEVQILETTPEYVHVVISADDGSFWRSFSPVTRTFIVHHDGRTETDPQGD